MMIPFPKTQLLKKDVVLLPQQSNNPPIQKNKRPKKQQAEEIADEMDEDDEADDPVLVLAILKLMMDLGNKYTGESVQEDGKRKTREEEKIKKDAKDLLDTSKAASSFNNLLLPEIEEIIKERKNTTKFNGLLKEKGITGEKYAMLKKGLTKLMISKILRLYN